MSAERDVRVHLLPELVSPESLSGSVAVVIDVLRATTTIVHALSAGCTAVHPCLEVEEAQRLANSMPAGKVLLAGERHGQPLPGFDLGNSPGRFTPQVCRDLALVLTTTNGTRALLRASTAARVLIAAFVNYSAVCEQLRLDARPVDIVCAGNAGTVALEDVLLAGALVDYLSRAGEVNLDDGARIAWDCFETEGAILEGALEVSAGGVGLRALGYDEDVRAAARVDQLALVPELRRDPLRIEVGAVGILKCHWLH
jgi:2-phosphosulfolactate phosphatase